MLLIHAFVFTILAPGTMVVLLPYLLLQLEEQTGSFLLLQIVGGILIAPGVLIYLKCTWDFIRRGRGTPAWYRAPKKLVVQGLYRYVRNPMYVGMGLICLGESLYFSSFILFCYTLGALLCFHLRVILYEEPVLRRQFGESYVEYCQRVNRWMPRVNKLTVSQKTNPAA
ncbi:MAG: methyltransferase family protein [bacterium]|jgi:protein-S-isoprenylcysteine O-methyltransferase Ste14